MQVFAPIFNNFDVIYSRNVCQSQKLQKNTQTPYFCEGVKIPYRVQFTLEMCVADKN